MTATPPHYRLQDQLRYGIDALHEGVNLHIIPDAIGAHIVETIMGEGHRIKKIYRRRRKEWERVSRSTLFVPGQPNNAPLVRGKSVPLVNRILDSSRLAPATHRFSMDLSDQIRDAAHHVGAKRENRLPGLESFVPNRVGFHYYDGASDAPALIPEHIDPPRLKGTVAVLDEEGTIKLIFSKDVCDQLGLPQPPHEISADQPEIHLTMSRLVF